MLPDVFLSNDVAQVPVLLAPMSGITDAALRRIARRWGADIVVSEMVAARGLVQGEEEARLRMEGEGIHPHVVQLAGRDPGWMAEAARLAEAAGADAIDINMGCPAKKVTGGLAGSALMREPDLAAAIVSAVTSAATVPVSLKMRLGWDSRSLNAPKIAAQAAALGVSMVTVHGRTRQQFYEGRADWAAIKATAEACPVPVIANGDIVDAISAKAALALSGAAGIMVGRGALGQPWIAGAIAAELNGRTPRLPSAAERTAIAIEHYRGLLSLYGRELGVRHARKHLAAYADVAQAEGRGLNDEERAELVRTPDPSRVLALLERLRPDDFRRAA